MKNFMVCTDSDTKYFVHASYVVEHVKNANLTDYEVYWKTPVTGEYHKLLEVEDGIRTYATPHFELPKAFESLGKKQ
jgi:hypothetical protein